MVSFLVLSLLVPKAAYAHHGAQLQGLGLLHTGNVNGFEETRFGFTLGVGGQGAGISHFCLLTFFFAGP